MLVDTYKTILHCLPVITIPVFLCGFYCVLYVRVRAISPSYRRLLLCYVILSLLAELTHTVFTTPVILAPLIAGYGGGLLFFLPTKVQYTLWLGFSIGSAMVMELQFHFRFNNLLTNTNILHLSQSGLRNLHLAFILYTLITCVQVYFSFTDSPAILLELSKMYPTLQEEMRLPGTIAISPEYDPYARFFYYYATSSIATHGVLIVSMIAFCYIKLSSGTSNLSTATRKTAKYYLQCLILQFLVHSSVLYVPFFAMFYAQYMLQILNRDITNIGMICCSVHGSCSILTMILVMVSYRTRLLRIILCRPHSNQRDFPHSARVQEICVLEPADNSNDQSVDGYTACLSLRVEQFPDATTPNLGISNLFRLPIPGSNSRNMFFWLCGLTKKTRKTNDNLSDLEIRSLKESWARAKKRGTLGQNILKSLIESKPLIKDHFGIKAAADDSDGLLQSEEFQLQAIRMETFLDNSIKALGFEHMSSVGAVAHRIGAVHFYRGVNFGADNWLAFKKVIIEQILTSTQRATLGQIGQQQSIQSFLQLQINGLFPTASVSAVAWEKFMGYIIREMKKGFLAEACRNCREDVA